MRINIRSVPRLCNAVKIMKVLFDDGGKPDNRNRLSVPKVVPLVNRLDLLVEILVVWPGVRRGKDRISLPHPRLVDHRIHPANLVRKAGLERHWSSIE